jgi:pantoate--beta-alanine ligase
VVTKLFHIVKPHVAVFGEKDYQQLLVIRKMVRDLNMDIEIIGGPIVREPDGLAMSSRNSYLTDEQRRSALSLNRALRAARARAAAGTGNCREIIDEAGARISAHPQTRVDYIRICDPETLQDVEEIKGPARMALAVWVGKTRLIDNILLSPAQQPADSGFPPPAHPGEANAARKPDKERTDE